MKSFCTFLRRRGRGGLLLALFAAIVGCGYGELSPRTYDYAKALYSICNRRDERRLDEFATLVGEDLRRGEISAQEADWLNDVVAQARGGHWEEANAAARQLLEDQVEGR
jgi:hypothetical protein